MNKKQTGGATRIWIGKDARPELEAIARVTLMNLQKAASKAIHEFYLRVVKGGK